jgi:hypothetical protein
MLESQLHQILAAALPDVRVYPVILPEDPTLPAVSFQRISTTRQYATTGPVGLNRVRLQFDCWSRAYAEVKRLQAALMAAFEDRSSYAGTSIDSSQLITASDGFEQAARIYRVSLDFYIYVTE